MPSSDTSSLLAELTARFGADFVTTPGASGADTYTGWYPTAVKERQAGGETPQSLAVVSPVDADSVRALVEWAGANGVALIPVGGGSNTVGSTAARGGANTVLVNLSRLAGVVWDETALTVTAGAGVLLADLEETLNRHQYTLGSLPRSARIATVGGAVATEAFGLFAAGYGGTRVNTLALEAVLTGGAPVRTFADSAATRALHHLLIGSEGAYGIVTSATLAIRPLPEVRAWCAFSFTQFADAADALRLIYRSDARPVCVRLFDAGAAAGGFSGAVPGTSALLLLGVEGSEVVQTGQYQTVFAVCKQVGGLEASVDGDAWYESERYRTDAFAANARPGTVADIVSLWLPWSSLAAAYSALTDDLRAEAADVSAQVGYATPHGAALELRFVVEAATPGDALTRHERILGRIQEIAWTYEARVAPYYGVGIARAVWVAAERGTAQTAVLQAVRAAVASGSR